MLQLVMHSDLLWVEMLVLLLVMLSVTVRVRPNQVEIERRKAVLVQYV